MRPSAVRPIDSAERAWALRLLTERWGESRIAVGGELVDLDGAPALVALDGAGTPTGLLTYRLAGDGLEVLTLDAVRPNEGVGSRLVAAAAALARALGARRLAVTTTNDNLDALRFYQRRGFVLAELRAGAVVAARRRKPLISAVGAYGIPIRDELVLECPLATDG